MIVRVILTLTNEADAVAIALFVDVPHPSISWIYASIGCQHNLLPTKDDYTPPSIPALTTKGFVRWQSIELLLGPEEHVPFIQHAVRNFAIKNPDTGESFPVDLPTESFPQHPDPEIEKWHTRCAERLRLRAAGSDSEGPAPPLPPRPKVQTGYVHVRRPAQSPRQERPTSVPRGYFDTEPRAGRPIPYQHVTGTIRPGARPVLNRSPSRKTKYTPPSPDEVYDARVARARRRSFPENLTPSPEDSGNSLRVPGDHGQARRHSQPRHVVRPSSSAEDDSTDSTFGSEGRGGRQISPSRRNPALRPHTMRIESQEEPAGLGVRYVTKGTPPTPTSPIRIERRDREREREQGYPLTIDLNGKLSAPFLPAKPGPGPAVGERRRVSRRNSVSKSGVKWKDLTSLTSGLFGKGSSPGDATGAAGRDSEEDSPKRRSSGERDKHNEGKEVRRRIREREREKDLSPREEVVKQSPRARTSSHDRDRYLSRIERERDRERESDRDGRSARDRERDRQRDRGRRQISPIRGVDGRKYPSGPPEAYR